MLAWSGGPRYGRRLDRLSSRLMTSVGLLESVFVSCGGWADIPGPVLEVPNAMLRPSRSRSASACVASSRSASVSRQPASRVRASCAPGQASAAGTPTARGPHVEPWRRWRGETFVGDCQQAAGSIQRVVFAAAMTELFLLDSAPHLIDDAVGQLHQVERVGDLDGVGEHRVEHRAIGPDRSSVAHLMPASHAGSRPANQTHAPAASRPATTSRSWP